MRKITAALVAAIALAACDPEGPPPEYVPPAPIKKTVQTINYTVVKKHPHDVGAFTEGLFFYKGKLFESTGAPDHIPSTRSTFGIVDTATGEIQVKAELDRNVYFGEGIAAINDKIYWVTWQNQRGFIYDANTFQKTGQFNYNNKEGWGLTVYNNMIVMSDGTYNLTFFDPADMSVVKTLAVTKDGYGLDHLNELEFINGHIYANVWMSNIIVKIDPESGRVVGQLDLSALYNEAKTINPRLGEMNGIAYDPDNNRVLVTGKFWPDMYEIRFAW